jgi:D-amino-acid dehydrogenase
MKVVVLGAGLAGVPTAYFLAKEGHEVVVIDRQPSAALETSYANGSLLCLGHAYPWASPAAPGVLLKSLVRRDQALRLSLRFNPRMWAWMIEFLTQCTSARADRNAASRLRLGTYSQEVMKKVVEDTGFDFFQTSKGLLYLYRTEHAMAEGVRQMRVLERNGLEIRIVDAGQVALLEPALAPVAHKLLGGVYVPTDGTGDARLFTAELARVTESQGVRYLYNTEVKSIEVERGAARAVHTSEGKIEADAIVVAMGSYSAPILRKYGIRNNVFPVKGYSLTVPITNPSEAPAMGGLDEDNLLAFSVLGNRLRLTATAEFKGFDVSHQPSDFRYMTQAAQDLFPTIGDYSKAEMWSGLRPATPTGTPCWAKPKCQISMCVLGADRWAGPWHVGWERSSRIQCAAAARTSTLPA